MRSTADTRLQCSGTYKRPKFLSVSTDVCEWWIDVKCLLLQLHWHSMNVLLVSAIPVQVSTVLNSHAACHAGLDSAFVWRRAFMCEGLSCT